MNDFGRTNYMGSLKATKILNLEKEYNYPFKLHLSKRTIFKLKANIYSRARAAKMHSVTTLTNNKLQQNRLNHEIISLNRLEFDW